MDEDRFFQRTLEVALALDGFLALCTSVNYILARQLCKTFAVGRISCLFLFRALRIIFLFSFLDCVE